MRSSRVLPTSLAITLFLSVMAASGGMALAQDTGRAQEEAADAKLKAGAAAGLVDEAVANRAAIEAELAATLVNISDISTELSVVAADLDRVERQILFADAEMTTIESAIEVQAVDAYMSALAFVPISFVNSETVETAMVTGVVVEEIVNASRETVDRLVGKKKELESLLQQHQTRQEEVATLQSELQSEVDRLASLYDQANSEVGAAIRAAAAADAEYRAALSAVDLARAKEAEKRRQEERPGPTTTLPDSTGTTSPATTAPPGTSPPTTDSGGGWTGPPAVEQWRPLVAQYFPASRVDEALQIIQCESLGDPDAYNPYSGASGLFQFLPSTWATTAPLAGFPGVSVFDPEANIGSAAWLAGRYEELGLYYWQPWSCRRVLG